MIDFGSTSLVTLQGGVILLGGLIIVRILHALWSVAEDRLAPVGEIQ